MNNLEKHGDIVYFFEGFKSDKKDKMFDRTFFDMNMVSKELDLMLTLETRALKELVRRSNKAELRDVLCNFEKNERSCYLKDVKVWDNEKEFIEPKENEEEK
jgi:hypothetical protein